MACIYIRSDSISLYQGDVGNNEILWAIEPRLQLKRSSPRAGLEPVTARSAGH